MKASFVCSFLLATNWIQSKFPVTNLTTYHKNESIMKFIEWCDTGEWYFMGYYERDYSTSSGVEHAWIYF